MNILFVHEIDWIAEEAFDIHFLAEGLSLMGHKVYAIDCEDARGKSFIFNLGRLLTRDIKDISRAFDGAHVFLRRPGHARIPGLRHLSAAFTHYLEIRRTIRENDIDAIVLYSVTTNGWQTVRLAENYGIPVVFRFTDIPNTLTTNPVTRPLHRFLRKKVYGAADALLPNTPRYRKYAEATGVDKSRLKYLPLPIDTTQFHPAVDSSEARKKWDIKETDAVIVYTGTLLNYSGLDDFIRGFPRILEEVPEARLLIVGKGTQRQKLHQIITELHLEEKVTLTGFQPYQMMPQYINLATVCINPYTVNDETIELFPEKMLRYVACGKPTVATPLQGIKTILPGKTHGVLYAREPEKIIEEVIALLKSPERREELGSAGLNKIKKTFSHEKVTAELERILRGLVEQKDGRSRPQ
jgi:glycosyltransferase involved in cell wall biosynthesis